MMLGELRVYRVRQGYDWVFLLLRNGLASLIRMCCFSLLLFLVSRSLGLFYSRMYRDYCDDLLFSGNFKSFSWSLKTFFSPLMLLLNFFVDLLFLRNSGNFPIFLDGIFITYLLIWLFLFFLQVSGDVWCFLSYKQPKYNGY